MSKRRIKSYEDEPEAVETTIGTVYPFSAVPKDNLEYKKDQIGFVRQKPARKKAKKK